VLPLGAVLEGWFSEICPSDELECERRDMAAVQKVAPQAQAVSSIECE
jgi:hypothetical protein